MANDDMMCFVLLVCVCVCCLGVPGLGHTSGVGRWLVVTDKTARRASGGAWVPRVFRRASEW